jgi:hypothetical protein
MDIRFSPTEVNCTRVWVTLRDEYQKVHEKNKKKPVSLFFVRKEKKKKKREGKIYVYHR